MSDQEVVRLFLQKHPQVQIIIAQWIDMCGVLRSRMTSAQHFVNLVASGGSFNGSALDMLQTSSGEVVPALFEYFCEERSHLHPDVSTLRVATHDAASIGNVATVMVEADWHDADPRTNLRRIVAAAEKEHQLRFTMGFELELCFFQQQGDALVQAGPRVLGASNASTTQRSTLWPVLNEAVVALAEAGILVEQVIKEYGPSQWELALPPLPPVESVDAYVYAREVIKNVAHKHGILATFYPMPDEGDKGGQRSGQHIHISAKMADDDGRAAESTWNPDELMAGILSHIPALVAVGLPQVDSYRRVVSSAMGAGAIVGWGDNNRDMPIRRIHKNHWEIRSHDACSNPYAMATGIIAAALDRKPLTIGSADKWTPLISQDELKELGQTQAMPQSLEAALAELETDRAWAEKALGKEYIRWFLSLKRAELKTVTEMGVEKRKQTMLHHF